MRGLRLFISDLRKCRCKEDEKKRINKELANIRSKFKGNKPLNGYHKKKYICKFLCMFLLGYSCDLGHMEAVNILSSNTYSEKQIGYLFISVVMSNYHQFVPLVLNAIENDFSSNITNFQNLALQFVANNATTHVAEALGNKVLELLISSDSEDFVKQTAALTLLQLLRNKPDIISSEDAGIRIVNLISSYHLGVVTASVSLVQYLACTYPLLYGSCVSHAVVRLRRITTPSCMDLLDYSYYGTNAPWISVKLLQLLQNFPAPSDVTLRARLIESLDLILNKAHQLPKLKAIEQNNAMYAVIFEAISTIIQMNVDSSLLYRAINILGDALKQNEPNMRCMSLYLMIKLSDNVGVKDYIAIHWESVLGVLRTEADITIKKCAVDLLYRICDITNVKPIVKEFLNFIKTEVEPFQEEVVLKSAHLAEHLSTDLKWYVDTIFNILQVCDSDANANIWYSLVKVVIENVYVQGYAARKAYTVLLHNSSKDLVVQAAGYILGEFGYLLAKYPGYDQLQQINILQQNFNNSSPSTRALLLTTYMKYLNKYPDLKDQIQSIFRDNGIFCSGNEEIQQRAVEYLKLSEIASKSTLATIFEEMPSSLRKESAFLEAHENKISKNFNDSSISLTDTNVLKYNSVCDIGNTTEIIKNEGVKISRATSNTNLRAHYSSNVNLLIDISDKNPTTVSLNTASFPLPTPFFGIHRIHFSLDHSNETFIHDLLFNGKGNLYQDGIINIFIESQFLKHYGKFYLIHINKSNRDLKDFTVVGNFANVQNKCLIEFKPRCLCLESNQSMRQDIFMECLNEFNEMPSLDVKFRYDNHQREIKVILPLTVNKFVEPATMSYELFIERWQTLGYRGPEVVKDFVAKYPMIHGVTRTKLEGFPVAVIENVQMNSSNYFCAGIFFARMCRIGFLLRLERYPAENRYRSVVISSQRSFSQNICNLLSELL